MSFSVRPALLDDTAAISALFRAKIPVWQRLAADGAIETVHYEQLTIYERWTHGGMWMSVETGAIHLGRLLRGIAMPYVAEVDGEIVGYAEAFPGEEPAPYGKHLHVAQLAMQGDYFTAADALMRHLISLSEASSIDRLTVSLAGQNDDMADFYRTYGFTPVSQVRRYTLPTREGQVFYKVNDYYNSSAAQIEGWYMPVGRTESAAHHWEALLPRHWDIIPQIANERVHRLLLTVSGQDVIVHGKRHPYDARNLTLSLWAPKPLTPQILSALRDWAIRQSYRTLTLVVDENTAKLLGTEAETDPFRRHTYALDV